jgi:hypothetical protein
MTIAHMDHLSSSIAHPGKMVCLPHGKVVPACSGGVLTVSVRPKPQFYVGNYVGERRLHPGNPQKA